MDEYIRREDAIKCIEGQCVDGKMWGNDESEGTLIEAYSTIDGLMEIPPADVAPVRHGRWNRPYISWFLPMKIKNPHSFCTNCAYPTKHKKVTRYCPNCGAMMDGSAE